MAPLNAAMPYRHSKTRINRGSSPKNIAFPSYATLMLQMIEKVLDTFILFVLYTIVTYCANNLIFGIKLHLVPYISPTFK